MAARPVLLLLCASALFAFAVAGPVVSDVLKALQPNKAGGKKLTLPSAAGLEKLKNANLAAAAGADQESLKKAREFMTSRAKLVGFSSQLATDALECIYKTNGYQKVCDRFVKGLWGLSEATIQTKKQLFWSGSGMQFSACQKSDADKSFIALEKTKAGAALNLLQDFAKWQWDVPTQKALLEQYFWIFDQWSKLYGEVVAARAKKGPTEVGAFLSVPKKDCPKSEDLFAKSILVKTEMKTWYENPANLHVRFFLVDKSPNGCRRADRVDPKENVPATDISPATCKVLGARLVAVCQAHVAEGAKCPGWCEANGKGPDACTAGDKRLKFSCENADYPQKDGKPFPDAQYACSYPEYQKPFAATAGRA